MRQQEPRLDDVLRLIQEHEAASERRLNAMNRRLDTIEKILRANLEAVKDWTDCR